MAFTKSIEIGRDTIYYIEASSSVEYSELSGMVVTGYKTEANHIEIPAEIQGMPVVAIGKKAFLGMEGIKKISIPASVYEIGDWACAHCVRLERVGLGGSSNIGKGAFEGCTALEHICVGTQDISDMSALRALVPNYLDAEFLMKLPENEEDWLSLWDQTLTTFLTTPDGDGYTDLVLCGEEDIKQSEVQYRSSKRRKKAYLCFARLMHSTGLSHHYKHIFKKYILRHGIEDGHKEAWKVLDSEYGDQVSYFELYASLGAIDEKNIDLMIADMSDENVETKAWMIKYKKDNFGSVDAFDEFEL